MIQERIRRIEQIILTSSLISEEKRAEILLQLRALQREVNEIPLHAENRNDPGLTSEEDGLPDHVEGLSESVRKFEASHPELVKKVNEICVLLANSGI